MRSKRKSSCITGFSQVAKILNRGNCIAIDNRGIEDGVPREVKAAWYLGKQGNYQRRITAPWLVEPLLEVASGLRMKLSVIKPGKEDGPFFVECLIGRGKHYGYGYCQLDIGGLTHDQKTALSFIGQAAFEAKFNYQATLAVMVKEKRIPQTFDGRDPLLAIAGQ